MLGFRVYAHERSAGVGRLTLPSAFQDEFVLVVSQTKLSALEIGTGISLAHRACFLSMGRACLSSSASKHHPLHQETILNRTHTPDPKQY